MSKDRPGGMDDLKLTRYPKPKEKTPAPRDEMPTVRKLAGGRVDGGSPKRKR